MVVRKNHDSEFAWGYIGLGILILLLAGMTNAWWKVFLAFGLWAIALAEFMGGEDMNRNYLFIILLGVLPFGILFASPYEYWVLVAVFLVWGAYEVIEERNITPTKWDFMGVGSLIIGGILLLMGAIGNTYPEMIGIIMGVVMTLQGLKELWD